MLTVCAVRAAPVLVRRASRMPLKAMAPRVPLQIRAFQEDAKHEQREKSGTSEEKQMQKHQSGQGSSMMRADPYSRFGRLPSIFSDMQREMDALTRSFRLWDDSDFLMAPFRSSPLFDMQRHLPTVSAPEMRLLRLATDIQEDDNAFTIKADIPGMSKEDVKIKVLDNTLTISGERKEEKEEGEAKEGKPTRVERSYGSFVRNFSLPQNVDVAGIKAASKDGVLTVTIPKVEEQKPQAHEIAIE